MEYDSTFLKHTKRIMLIMGLWPMTTSSYWKYVCYKIYFIVAIVNYAVFVFTLVNGIQYALNAGPLQKADVIQNSLLYFLLLWKILLTTTGQIQKLIKEISNKERYIMNLNNKDLKNIYVDYVNYNYKMFFVVTGIVIMGLTQFCTLIYFETKSFINNMDRKLPLPEWFPYNVERHFFAAYSYQSFNRVYSGVIIVATDPLVFSLVYFPTIRLKLLGSNLTGFQECCNQNKTETPDNILKALILEHKDIMRYINDFNRIMRWYFFMDFLVRSYHISLVLFRIMALRQSKGNSADTVITLSFSITYLLVLVFQMHILYYHANELRLASIDISSHIFQSNWYDQSPSCKRSFSIMMMRSQKPLEIHIGNLNTITADLIVKVFKAGYTYILLSKP